MKRKVLKSIAHNFSHSFMSYMNYFNDGYIVDDILKMSRDAKWRANQNSRSSAVPSNAPPSCAQEYRPLQIVASHGKNSGVSIDAIREFRTDIFLKPINRLLLKRIWWMISVRPMLVAFVLMSLRYN